MRPHRKPAGILTATVTIFGMRLMSVLTVYGSEKKIPVTLTLPKSDLSVDIYVPEVKTGDDTVIWMYIIPAAIAVLFAAIVLFYGRKKHTKNNCVDEAGNSAS